MPGTPPVTRSLRPPAVALFRLNMEGLLKKTASAVPSVAAPSPPVQMSSSLSPWERAGVRARGASVQLELHQLERRRLLQRRADAGRHRGLHAALDLRRIPDHLFGLHRARAPGAARLRLAAQHQLDGAKAPGRHDDVLLALDD